MKVAYFTNIAPHYREALWLKLAQEQSLNFHFFFGSPSSKGIRPIDFDAPHWKPYLSQVNPIKNKRIKGLLFWQDGVIKEVLNNSWDEVIFLGDMYILSNWIAAIVAKWKGFTVAFWGHGIYGNEKFFKGFIRKLFLRIADKHYLYSHFGKQQMLKLGFQSSAITVVYNSLDYDRQLILRNKVIDSQYYASQQYFKNNNLPVLIFIGRLTPEKKLGNLLMAVSELNAKKDIINLMIVGNGIEKQRLIEQTNGSKGTIFFFGKCYNEREIGYLLANATLCVSPGNVGLTAIHSLGFGTPVCTHDNLFNQMPEVESIVEGLTGTFFSLDKNNLSITILRWLNSQHDREKIRRQCYRMVDDKYNPQYQMKIFNNAILGVM